MPVPLESKESVTTLSISVSSGSLFTSNSSTASSNLSVFTSSIASKPLSVFVGLNSVAVLSGLLCIVFETGITVWSDSQSMVSFCPCCNCSDNSNSSASSTKIFSNSPNDILGICA